MFAAKYELLAAGLQARGIQTLPSHAESIADLEELSLVSDHKARIVDILRPLYERADDWRHQGERPRK